MYIESVPNRNSPPAVLLRESFRDAGKANKRTLANLSKWPPTLIEGLRVLLKGGAAVARYPNPRMSACQVSIESLPCSSVGLWVRIRVQSSKSNSTTPLCQDRCRLLFINQSWGRRSVLHEFFIIIKRARSGRGTI